VKFKLPLQSESAIPAGGMDLTVYVSIISHASGHDGDRGSMIQIQRPP